MCCDTDLMYIFDNFRAHASCSCGYLKQDLILPDGENVSEISAWCIVIHSIIAPNNV